MRPVLIYDCEVLTPSYLRCNGCGAQTSTLGKLGRLHDCPTRGAWQLVREVDRG